jgi:hypothetical protein
VEIFDCGGSVEGEAANHILSRSLLTGHLLPDQITLDLIED